MKCWNRECFNVLDPRAVSCPVCGWDKPSRTSAAAAFNPDAWRCCDTDQAGNRCSKPGSLGDTVRGFAPGTERWFCAAHYPPFKARGFRKDPPPPGLFKPPTAKTAASIAEDFAERQAIQNEGI